MKKISIILSLLLIFACEDDKADETAAVNLDGTYKLSSKSWDCDGDEDIIYMTISGKNIIDCDYEGDECEDDEDCYAKESISLSGGEDGVYQFDADGSSGGTMTFELSGKELKHTMSFSGISWTRYWDHVSDKIETYSPVCPYWLMISY